MTRRMATSRRAPISSASTSSRHAAFSRSELPRPALKLLSPLVISHDIPEYSSLCHPWLCERSAKREEQFS